MNPISPLPSRRPGAALAAGPLAAATPSASAAPAAPSPFEASAAAPFEASDGPGAAAGRAGGGFGAPGRPLAAGSSPVIRRPTTGAGAPSAATAAAAAAAARAARAGGSGPGAASALFAARGPATDGRGTPPVEDIPTDDQRGSRPEDLPDGSLLAPDMPRTTGSGRPVRRLRTPAASDRHRCRRRAGPARTTRRPRPASAPRPFRHRRAGRCRRPTARPTTAGEPDDGAQVPAPAEPLSGEFPRHRWSAPQTPIFDTVSMWFSTDSVSGRTERVIDLRDRPDDDASRGRVAEVVGAGRPALARDERAGGGGS